MSSTADWSPGRLAWRTALVQGILAAGLWLILGYWNARHSWLLESFQEDWIGRFFWKELPVGGAAFVVALPAFWIYRLADRASLDVVHETSLLDAILSHPLQVATMDILASVLLFLFGALQLRLFAQAPAIEAAKVASFGFVTGVLFGILSYFLLQPVDAPLLVAALARGARPSGRPAFPLTQKLIVACVSIAFVVTGLLGGIALSWAQRVAEGKTEERARSELRRLADDARRLSLRDAAKWSSYLAGQSLPPDLGSVSVLDAYGRRIASAGREDAISRHLLQSEEIRERLGRLAGGATSLRWGETRVATSVLLYTGWRIVSLAAPDPGTLKQFLASVVPVAVEIFVLSVLVACAVGVGLTRPVRDLDARTREFGKDPQVSGLPMAPTDDEIGALASSFAEMQDEIRAVQARLRESERRAATAELLAGVAHEVRNPLFGITSTVEALAQEMASESRVAPHLAVIRKESERLSRMMEEMLSLQRLPRGPTGSAKLRPILEGAAERIRARFAGRSPEIRIDCASEIVLAGGDRESLESVFLNLFENSVLSTPNPARIHCRAKPGRERVEIEIEDNGPGVKAELLDRIFDPFVSSRPGGTGIGLTLCRRIVNDHGGTIRAEGSASGSAVFRVSLPTVV
ncbi:MAG: ATP-binding protein [Thermoanaerobaculia bacterium]